ncbi:signal peptidase II [Paenibacillus tengchongensis]|uniref:signal peptidase II n=1 Tax=Paenibacillus tengchongensis TaxID=2608684 RepID=UPI00124DC84B|nr:signal peptidase II [Paenibacillus tengchongensis]
MLFYVICGAVLLADQAAKWAVRTHMHLGETVPGIGPYLHFTYYENAGAAFSLFQGYGRYFAIIAAIFVAAVLIYRRKGKLKGRLLDAASGFMVGGAIGNGIDRALYGRVTDFLVFGGGGGILNLADLAINLGWLLGLMYLVRAEYRERRLYRSRW